MRRSLSLVVVCALASLLWSSSLLVSVSGQASTTAAMNAAALNDVTVLNYALTLENLEATFYAQGLAMFNTPAMFNGISATVPNGTVVYNYLQMIAGHEASHVMFLTTAINAAVPGAAVPACTYKFAAAGAFASPLAFVQTAAVLENTGQTAYDGALDGITTPAYAEVAAQIATVEGRHAAFLNLLTGTVPFPQAFDNATLPTLIAAAITPFLVSCPYNILLPVVRPTGVTLGATNTTFTSTGANGTLFGYSTAQKLNDIVALNYALTLENFEAAFYNYSLTTFTAAQFTAAGLPSYYYPYVQIISSHEALHAATLSMVIASRGGVPVPVCKYNFSSVATVAAVLSTAAVLENTGVMAYDGAANAITDTALQTVAAQIATVEARHASFLNFVNGVSPFPTTQDNGTAPAIIIAAVVATGFISCPYTPTGPVVLSAFTTPNAGTVSGDPAFVGLHGQRFQVHGIPGRHFALISTPTVQLSATFTMIEDGQAMTAGQMRQARTLREVQQASASSPSARYPLPITTAFSHSGTFLGVAAIQVAGRRLLAKAGPYVQGISSVELDGVRLQVSPTPIQVAPGAYLTHATPHTLTVDTDELSFTLVNSDTFFNIQEATLNRPYTDDQSIDGLLGQTADPQWQVSNSQEFKDHLIYDYLIASSDIFSTDFNSNRYTAVAAAKPE